jgi:hypothetical protein
VSALRGGCGGGIGVRESDFAGVLLGLVSGGFWLGEDRRQVTVQLTQFPSCRHPGIMAIRAFIERNCPQRPKYFVIDSETAIPL